MNYTGLLSVNREQKFMRTCIYGKWHIQGALHTRSAEKALIYLEAELQKVIDEVIR